MDKSSIGTIIMMFVVFAAGVAAAFPTASRDQKIMAKGAVAVYEHRAVCEKALDQWVCNLPKE